MRRLQGRGAELVALMLPVAACAADPKCSAALDALIAAGAAASAIVTVATPAAP